MESAFEMNDPGETPAEWLSFHRPFIQEMLKTYGGEWSDIESLAYKSDDYDGFCEAFGVYFAERIWNHCQRMPN